MVDACQDFYSFNVPSNSNSITSTISFPSTLHETDFIPFQTNSPCPIDGHRGDHTRTRAQWYKIKQTSSTTLIFTYFDKNREEITKWNLVAPSKVVLADTQGGHTDMQQDINKLRQEVENLRTRVDGFTRPIG